jgi:hypothetical protein
MPKTSEQSQINKYLLGELRESETDAFEEHYFMNDEAFLELQAAEMALVDAYVRKEMSDEDRRQFEANYLVSPERQAKAAAATAFHAELLDIRPDSETSSAKIGWLSEVLNYFSFSFGMQFAGAALILVLALSTTWLFIDRHREHNDLLLARNNENELNQRLSQREQELNERLAEQRGEDSESLSALQNDVDSLRGQLDAARKKANAANTTSDLEQTPLIATIFLSAARGGIAAAPTVDVSKNVKVLNIKVPISAADKAIFDIEVSSGDKVLLKRSMSATKITGGQVLNISVPATAVENGRYTVTMRNENGEVSTRSFSVVRN